MTAKITRNRNNPTDTTYERTIIIGMIIIGILVFLVMFIALFYYLVAKKPKVEPGEYKLEESKGKED